ncbi:MAG: FHA domain-containing protein [Myxococcota bacterium]
MAALFELVVQGDTDRRHAVAIGPKPCSVGRSPDNDLVVPDEMVSRHHLMVWSERGTVWIADAGSANGTSVNGVRLLGSAKLARGDTITVGSLKLRLEHREVLAVPSEAESTPVALEDLHTGLRHPFRGGRFVIGSAEDADLRIAGVSPHEVELVLHGPDEAHRVTVDGESPIVVGEPFEVAGAGFRLVHVAQRTRISTEPMTGERFPYLLRATLNGPTGPVAELSDLSTDQRLRIEIESRAVLLYVLGRRVVEDRQRGVPREEAGWLSSDEVARGVWGRSRQSCGTERLKTLVQRVRTQARHAGFNPWFIERRGGRIRVHVRRVAE